MVQRMKEMWQEITLTVLIAILVVTLCNGCVGVDPTASQTVGVIAPALTAEEIRTVVQTVINSNQSIVNDLWPVVAMVLIAMVGAVVLRWVTLKQTDDIKRHVDECNGHS